ncbi:17201_t:CDS:2 [Racocetra fulgida]|uniref:17201_t:CDS:1 n=1 Tax=Racocetra fulgida TaxID=60492 RepID=A0A9N9CV34_9GLOM|nr:17201_t:CDS:2 [Racocetra fulgida]
MSETVVFLGNLTIASRGIQYERAISLGYSVSPIITESTTYVVCGQDVGAEIEDAKKFGLTILNEQEWENLTSKREDDGLNFKPTKNSEKKRERDESSDDESADKDEIFSKPTTYMVARNKFWEIRLDGRKTYIRIGNIGDKGEITMKEHKSLADAKQSMNNLIARKTSQGFKKQDKPSSTADAKAGKKPVTTKRHLKRQKTHVNSNDKTFLDDDKSIEENADDPETSNTDDGQETSASPPVSNNTFKSTFKKTATLPSSITNAKPKSILKGNIPDLLLAHPWKEDEVDPTGWWISEKLDGVRAFWCGKRGLPKDIDLDGELFGGRGKFQSTVSIVKAGVEEWKKITYQVFDVPSYSNAPFEDRMAYIEDLVEKHKQVTLQANKSKYIIIYLIDYNIPPYVQLVQHRYCKSAKDIFDELNRVEAAGGEGLMIRKPKSEYVRGRSNTLLKIKSFYDGEALLEGYEPGKGKYTGMTGALKCVMACGKKFKVGSGLKLSDGGHPRFPTFIGVAADKTEPKDPNFGQKLKIK